MNDLRARDREPVDHHNYLEKIMSLTYSVVVLREKGGEFSVVVPALEGCATYGETLPEALRNIEEASLRTLTDWTRLGSPSLLA
jgi:predicted RNase H-like HicB family nuclease